MTQDQDQLRRAVGLIAQGRSLLFVGSGFSKSALNYDDQELLLAGQLADYFSKELKEDVGVALDTISGQFLEERGEEELCDVLKRLFTAKTVRDEQKRVSRAPWQRIYTTNYDNVVEACLADVAKPASLSRSSSIREIPADGLSIIHLNGYVQTITPDNVKQEVLLTDFQYLTNELRDSPWATRLRADMHGARNIFFVGYSLYDFDVTKLLLESGALGKKVFFIQHEALKSSDQKRLSRFGEVHTLGLAAFAELLSNAPAPVTVDNTPGFLVNFRRIERSRDSPKRANPDQARELWSLGTISRPALVWDIVNGKSSYRAKRERTEQIETLASKDSQSIFLFADVGNGKKVLAAEIVEACLAAGKQCFRYEPKTGELFDDLRYLQRCGSEEDVVLLIPNFYDYEHIIENMRAALPRATFVALGNASTRQLRDSPQSIAGELVYEFEIDALSNAEIARLDDLIFSFGRWGEHQGQSKAARENYIRKECGRSLRSVILSLFDQADIRSQLAEIFGPALNESTKTKGAIIRILALTAFGHNLSFGEMCEVVGPEFANELIRSKQRWIKEFFDVRDGRFCFESAVLAHYLLQNLVDDRTILDELEILSVRLYKSARGDETFNRLRNLPMRFSMVEKLLDAEGKAEKLVDYYEALRRHGFANANPLFWLQYAIACMSFMDYVNARDHFDVAFSLAEGIPGYDDYQIQNHWARFLLAVAIDRTFDVDPFEQFEQAHEIVIKQASAKTHGVFPYRVASQYLEFIKSLDDDLDASEARRFRDACDEVLAQINFLDETSGKRQQIKITKSNLLAAREIADAR